MDCGRASWVRGHVRAGHLSTYYVLPGKSSSAIPQASFLISHPRPTVGRSYSRRCPTTEPCQKVWVLSLVPACSRRQCRGTAKYLHLSSDVPLLSRKVPHGQAKPTCNIDARRLWYN